MTWAELTHPDDLAADVANFQRAMAGEIDGYSMDKRFIRKDGQVIDTTISVKCLRREDGAVDYFVRFLQDITARKKAEATRRRPMLTWSGRVAERTSQLAVVNEDLRNEITQRRKTEKLLGEAHRNAEVMLDSITAQFFSVSHDWRFTYLNKHAQDQMRILGKDPANLIGSSGMGRVPKRA